MSALHVLVLSSAGVGALLVGLSAVAPRAWYGWTPARRKLLSRWRVEMGFAGAAIFIASAVALLIVAAPQ